MPPLHLDIPLQVLQVGETTFGPATVDDDVHQATLSIDRTVSRGPTEGFNGQPATTTGDLRIEVTYDGGTTWQLCAGAGFVGGLYPDGDAGNFTESYVSVTLAAGTARRVRATVIIAGARVAVAGTLAVT